VSTDEGSEQGVYADRVFRYAMPQWHLYLELTDHRSSWLRLQPGEVEPRVVRADAISRVLWSSFWPVSPDDIIDFSLSTPDAGGSAMRMRWLSSSPPDDRGIAITRQRLGRKFGGDLRGPDSDFRRPIGR
jgi:hypothetical protein